MIITGMAHFESVCKNALVKWYYEHTSDEITLENVFVVWAAKLSRTIRLCCPPPLAVTASVQSIPITATSRSFTRMYMKS